MGWVLYAIGSCAAESHAFTPCLVLRNGALIQANNNAGRVGDKGGLRARTHITLNGERFTPQIFEPT